jgi:hypothetical protein
MLQRYIMRIAYGSNWIRILSNGGRDNEIGVDKLVYCVGANGSNWIRILSNGGKCKEIEEDITEICSDDWRWIKLDQDLV